MSRSERCRDKVSLKSVGGPSKPFVDDNLQFQLPNWISETEKTQSHHRPIYSHFTGSVPSIQPHSQIYEDELLHSMNEVDRSFDAWKRLKERIEHLKNTQ